MEVKLLTSAISPFGMRVRMGLVAKGLKYETVWEDISNKSPLLLKSNPVHKKVPVLIHNGQPISESLIILRYIDETWPSAHDHEDFLPKDPYRRAMACFWADYIDRKWLELFISIWSAKGVEAKQIVGEELHKAFALVDSTKKSMNEDEPYFNGKNIGLVDIVLGCYIPVIEAMSKLGYVKLPDEERCSTLRQWMDTLSNHFSFKETCVEPTEVLERIKIVSARLSST